MTGTVITLLVAGFLTVMTCVIAIFSYYNLYGADLYAVRAKRAYEAGQYEKAKLNYEEALKLKRFKVSTKALCLEGIALCLFQLGEDETAFEKLKEAESESNVQLGCYVLHASKLIEKHEVRAAFDLLRTIENVYGEDKNLNSMIAVTAMELGFLELAEKQAQIAQRCGYEYAEKLLQDIEAAKPE